MERERDERGYEKIHWLAYNDEIESLQKYLQETLSSLPSQPNSEENKRVPATSLTSSDLSSSLISPSDSSSTISCSLSLSPSLFLLSSSGNTCLHIASAANSLRVVRFLISLQNQTLLNYINQWNETPLHLAVAANNFQVVSLLLQGGADWTCQDKWNRTPKIVS
jgi:ankyrin repeat protein